MWTELALQKWEKAKSSEDTLYLAKGQGAVYDFPETIDMRNYEEIAFFLEPVHREILLKITLYPLASGRPELIGSTTASVWIAPGMKEVTVPFERFDYSELVSAHMRYISSMEIILPNSEQQEEKLEIRRICLKKHGDFQVFVDGTASKAAEAGERIIYNLILDNEKDTDRYVTVNTHWLGRESVSFDYPDRILLMPGEKKHIIVTAVVPQTLPRGGFEKRVLEWTADGDGEKRKRTVLYASRKREHPYLLHTREGWERLRRVMGIDASLADAFMKEYVQDADAWEVPKPHGGEYVYCFTSQDIFYKTGIAWKLTGNQKYLDKLLAFINGLLDDEHGYFATESSYFQFVESEKEYYKGSFPEHRACNAGWVQEAGFMTVLAIVYDLIYDQEEAGEELHGKMEKLMRSYIEFEDWRLKDGDGNNFQMAEASAALFFACIMQDYPLINRFLSGINGLYALMGSVFTDDGSYFEGASGYMRLAAEILLQDAVAMENLGINFKDIIIPAAHDKYVINAPWAVREETHEDGKPFLGMSFERQPYVQKPVRKLKNYLDSLRCMLNPQGICFSANDSNEQDFVGVMQLAYYVYGDFSYLEACGDKQPVNILFGPHMVQKNGGNFDCVLNMGNGYAILREKKGEQVQAVLKFGQHGGYHGHFDRLSLLSYMKGNQTFHNNEYAWYGYDSFLFKMWVQTSMAHNMTVVDCRMQKPSRCRCIYYNEGELFRAVCAETVTEWIDPPYGGQTPYPFVFPEEKCAKEGRFILIPDKKRNQGDIGEYSEPIFQRRLLILFHGYCIVWDYLEGQEIHRYDCLYHPMGRFDNENNLTFAHTDRFSEDPFGAGQFIMNCVATNQEGVLCLKFHDAQSRVNENDIVDNMPESAVWRAYPLSGEIVIGRYPQRGDSFTEENRKASVGYLEEPLKKTVAFTVRDSKAGFITLLEAGRNTEKIKSVSCKGYDSIIVTEDTGESWKISAEEMEKKDGKVSVSIIRTDIDFE